MSDFQSGIKDKANKGILNPKFLDTQQPKAVAAPVVTPINKVMAVVHHHAKPSKEKENRSPPTSNIYQKMFKKTPQYKKIGKNKLIRIKSHEEKKKRSPLSRTPVKSPISKASQNKVYLKKP